MKRLLIGTLMDSMRLEYLSDEDGKISECSEYRALRKTRSNRILERHFPALHNYICFAFIGTFSFA